MPRKNEHYADVAIKKAAEEIDAGRYVPDPVEDVGHEAVEGLGLSLGLGSTGAAVGEKPLLEDFRATQDGEVLARHPRVEEALLRMQSEIDDHPDAQESVEMNWMLWEMLEKNSYDQKWAGQKRWEGKENREMRYGRILSPSQFYGELCAVIGDSRVFLGRYAYKTHPEAKSARLGLYVRNPVWKGTTQVVEFAQVKAEELKKTAEKELVRAKRLRLAKHNAEADKAYTLAGDMIQAATEIHMEQAYTTEAENNKEFLRVGILQWPLGTEWMMMKFNEFGVPTTPEFTGWRTALLTMVRQHVITEAEAEEAFPVGQGPAEDWFKKQLWLRRNKGYRPN